MNFSITGDGSITTAIIYTLLIFGALIFVLAIFNGLWRTRRGAPTLDEEDDPAN